MKKFFKIFVTALVTAALACTVGLFAACGNGGDGGDNTPPATDNSPKYNITVVGSDDQPIDGTTDGANGGEVGIQICLPASNCIPLNGKGYSIGTDGKITFTQTQINDLLGKLAGTTEDVTAFDFHVIGVPGYERDCFVSVNGTGDYTLTLTPEQATTPEEHVCESVCPLCGKCTDETCTDPVCADKCEGHVYNLTIKLPDGSAAANASVKIGAASIKANAEGKVTLDLINNLSYLGGAKEEYTFEITSGDYSASVTLKATQESAEGYNVTVTLE